MTQFRRIVTGLTIMAALFGGHKYTNAATNDTYELKDMFQTVVTPTEWSTDQAQHDQLPDIRTMPKLDKEAIYLYYAELETERHGMTLKRRKFMKDRNLELAWEDMSYAKYNDGMLEFDFWAAPKNSHIKKQHIHFFQDKEGKIYEQTVQPTGKRTLEKKWIVNPSSGLGSIEDFKNHIKWAGHMTGVGYNHKNSLAYTEILNTQESTSYNYKAEFTNTKTPYGEEVKFKATHISTVDGKSSKPVVTETIYKGSLLSLIQSLGVWKGYPRAMKTFKTIER